MQKAKREAVLSKMEAARRQLEEPIEPLSEEDQIPENTGFM